MKNIYRAGALILMALSLAGFAWSAPSVTLLYSFGLDSSKGKGHVSGLIVGQQGALYGTTSEGGANGYGTVFKLIPPALPGGSWKETVLYSFCQQPQCFDGSYPIGRLVAYQGALYGTTTYGGNDCGWSGCGTIFKLLPPASPGGPWTYAVIYYFKTAGDGTNPMAGLIVDQQGVLYGTTNGGGQYGNGTVFKLPQDTGHGWNETVLYSFTGGNDGDSPMGDLVFDAKGNPVCSWIGNASMSARMPMVGPGLLPSITATMPVLPTPVRNLMPSFVRNAPTAFAVSCSSNASSGCSCSSRRSAMSSWVLASTILAMRALMSMRHNRTADEAHDPSDPG